VLTKSPRWNPGIQNGKPVRVLYSSDPNSNSGLMLEKGIKIQKKSLKERFLLVMAILFFVVYLVLGLLIIFMKKT
jgi:preprotein translocase subunit SecG